MRISGIYQIQSKNKPDRIYIGSTTNIYKRWYEHLRTLKKQTHHSKKLQRHFNKYGESDLQFSILLGCDKGDLIKIEQFFLDSYNLYFNNYICAKSRLNIKHTEETKEKIRLSHLGKKHKLESIYKMRGNKNRKGKPSSLEAIEKNRQKSLNKKASKETRIKMSNSAKKAWELRKKK